MKLHADSSEAHNTVTAYGKGYIDVNHVRFTHAITFGPQGAIVSWPVTTAAQITLPLLYQAAGLAETRVDPLAFLEAPEQTPTSNALSKLEVLLIGTGSTQCLLTHDLLRPLLTAGIGVEAMDTHAAARTYNILMMEGRRVVVALIPSGERSHETNDR